jgi:hypothetical protein
MHAHARIAHVARIAHIARVARIMTLAAFAATAMAGQVAAQQAGGGQPSVDDLKAPASPAFVLLDVAPSKVERPQAVRPLVLSALAAAGDGGLPRNYAVEFAPYWLGTPEISFDDYYNPGARALLQHLSVSLATTPIGGADPTGTAIGLGMRTLALPGRAHPQLVALRRKLVTAQLALNRVIGSQSRRRRLITLLRSAEVSSAQGVNAELGSPSFDELVKELGALDRDLERREGERDDVDVELAEIQRLPENERKARQEELEKKREALNQQIAAIGKSVQALAVKTGDALDKSAIPAHLTRGKQLDEVASRLELAQDAEEQRLRSTLQATALKIQALDRQRVGALLAVAGALAWSVPDDDSSRASLSKVGVWATPGYRIAMCASGEADAPCSTSLDALGVIRYLDDRLDGEDGVWELGGRVVWQPTATLAVSAEVLGRTGSNADIDEGTRVVGLAEYRVTDDIYLHASFGRDFKDPAKNRSLVSVIGLTFGFGSRPVIQ